MDLNHLNWLDLAIIAIIGFSTLISFIRGFIREALSLTIWVVALYLAYVYSDMIAGRYLTSIEEQNIRIIAAFLIIFFAVLIVGAFINYLFSRLVQSTGLSGTDRILGLGFGVARGILLIAVMIMVAEMTVVAQNKFWKDSQLVPQFEGLTQWLHSKLPEGIEKLGQATTTKKSEEAGKPETAPAADEKTTTTSTTTSKPETTKTETNNGPASILSPKPEKPAQ